MGASQPVPVLANRLLLALFAFWAVVWCVTAIRPVDRGDWLVENLLVFVFVPFLLIAYRRLQLSNGAYVSIFAFLILHAVGAQYAYQPPLGDWLKDTLHLKRNHYDRLVHFSFGLLLTRPIREVIMRHLKVRGFLAWWIPVSSMVAISGLFEIVEMLVAQVLEPELGAAYLGIQGDEWDAQKDIGLAAIGTMLANALAQRHSRLAS